MRTIYIFCKGKPKDTFFWTTSYHFTMCLIQTIASKDTRSRVWFKYYYHILIVYVTVCVNNCTGRIDGDYQSCSTCYGYVTCSGKVLYHRPCQNGHPGKPLVWDEVQKGCDEHFRTCHPVHTFESKPGQLNTFDWK